MKPNVWLATFGVISAILIGGAAFFCVKAKGGYDDAMSGWDLKKGRINTLSRKVPYPEQAAQDKLQAQLDDYKEEVKTLYDRLNEFQKPLNTELSDVDFQLKVRAEVDELVAKAGSNGFTIENEEEFFMGFDIYKTKIPDPKMVPQLDYELGAIDRLINLLIDQEADSLEELTRDLIPGEEGAVDIQDANAVANKYPIRLRFVASHESFQKFINTISNDKEYFYTIRVMRIENENSEPPAKLAPAGGLEIPKFVNPLTQEVATMDVLEAEGYVGGEPTADVIEKMKAKGFQMAGEDARVLMGGEKIEIYMVVDIVRFLNPEEVQAAAEEAPAKSGRPTRTR